jgi:hypothetical protein
MADRRRRSPVSAFWKSWDPNVGYLERRPNTGIGRNRVYAFVICLPVSRHWGRGYLKIRTDSKPLGSVNFNANRKIDKVWLQTANITSKFQTTDDAQRCLLNLNAQCL